MHIALHIVVIDFNFGDMFSFSEGLFILNVKDFEGRMGFIISKMNYGFVSPIMEIWFIIPNVHNSENDIEYYVFFRNYKPSEL